MEDKSSAAKDGLPKKLKFAPKIPRKSPIPIEPKSEKNEADDALSQELLKRVKEGFARSGPKVEKKSAPVQVTFGQGATTFARSSGFVRGPPSGSGAVHKGPISDGYGSASKMQKEYVEPWDYYSYYPVTLPLRRPYSGNPELLDEEEFGEVSACFDETQINSAAELGLSGKEAEKMFLFQLPPLPLAKRSASTKGNEIVDDPTTPPRRKDTSEKGCSLKDLPAGFLGKMLVYKSGAVKMKIGDALFDVTPGIDCSFAQEVAAINTEGKHCCILGEVSKHAVVTPEVDSLVDAIANLD